MKEGLCEKRGCDGVPRKELVWYDGPFLLQTCPVRELDPAADEYLDWFARMYRRSEFGWTLIGWPATGAIGDQDAHLLEGVDMVRRTVMAVTREQQMDVRQTHSGDVW